MDFLELITCFDGSIFPDDYRTYFENVDFNVRSREAGINPQSSAQDEAAVLLLRTVRSAMLGNFSVAVKLLERLQRLAEATHDAALSARCRSYAMYVATLKRYPGVLRFRNDKDSGEGMIKDMQLRSAGDHENFRELRRLQEASPDDLLERKLFEEYSRIPWRIWTFAQPRHSRYRGEDIASHFDEDADFSSECDRRGMCPPEISAHLKRLTAEYLVAGESARATEFLETMSEAAEEAGDKITVANCFLVKGDNHYSPPFTSLLALNLVTVVTDLGWNNEHWDSEEQNLAVDIEAPGGESYNAAMMLFAEAESARGVAAVMLRLACFVIARWVQSLAEGVELDTETGTALVSMAVEKLDVAGGFRGDVSSTLMVNTHRTVLHILAGEFDQALSSAFGVGAFAKSTENVGIGHFCGMLLLRAGRQLSRSIVGQPRAVVCCACAKACFIGLQDPYMELHAIVAAAKLSQSMGNCPTAVRHMINGRDAMIRVKLYFDKLLERCSGPDEQSAHDTWILRTTRDRCIVSFDRAASSVLSRNESLRSEQAADTHQSVGSSPVATLFNLVMSTTNDPTITALAASLQPGFDAMARLEQEYKDACERYWHEITHNADYDTAEQFLREALQSFDSFPFPGGSSNVDTWRLVICEYLGDYEQAASIIPRVIPATLGGARSGVREEFEELSGRLDQMLTRSERHNASHSIWTSYIAKDWEGGYYVCSRIRELYPTYYSDLLSSEDPNRWFEMTWIARIQEQNGEHVRAFLWYLAAFEDLETERKRLTDVRDRGDMHSTIYSQQLFNGLASIALAFSNGATGSNELADVGFGRLSRSEWQDQAVRFLELGRSRTLLDLLSATDAADRLELEEWALYIHNVRKEQHTRPLPAAPQSSKSGEQNNSTFTHARREVLRRIKEELNAELNAPNIVKFLPEHNSIREGVSRLYASIPSNALVLYIVTGRDMFCTLCMTTQGVARIHYSDATDLDLRKAVNRYCHLLYNPVIHELPTVTACVEASKEVTRLVLDPAKDLLVDKEHIIFIASGALNKFPFADLEYDGTPLILSKDVSQVPSLSVLAHLASKERPPSSSLEVVFKAPQGGDLLISTACALDTAERFGVRPKAADSVTTDDFSKLYEQAGLLLIATHGEQGTRSAWESSILLEPPLQVMDMAKLRSNAALVVFEACVSGLGEHSSGGDVVGFSHAVLASGVSAFLGSLWKVSDLASALQTAVLFEQLSEGTKGLSLARCVRNAQTRLYHMGVTEAVEILSRFSESCTRGESNHIISAEFAGDVKKTLGFAIGDIEEDSLDLRHPFYWAPFVLVGNGSLVTGE